MKKNKKITSILLNKMIEDKNVKLLLQYLTKQGLIMTRSSSSLSIQEQKCISRAIKRARNLKLISLNVPDINRTLAKKNF